MQLQTSALDSGTWREAGGFDVARIHEVALRAALATSQRDLRDALARIEALLARDRLLTEEVRTHEQAVEKARESAYRDELTGLPNRRLLQDRFNQAAAQAERHQHQVSLMFLDIDGFKRINDRFGHAAGDTLLQQFAARLTKCIRSSDTACRYGGDEFVVLLPAIDSENTFAAVTKKIRANLKARYVIADTRISVSASFGTAVYPVHGQTYGDLIKASDRDMYQSKHSAARIQPCKPLQPITGIAS